MFKKLGIFVLLSALLAGCQTTSETDRKKGKELSASECPVNLGGEILSKANEKNCNRYLSSNNVAYYYLAFWSWKDDSSDRASFIYYAPIKSYQYWKNKEDYTKELIHSWDGFKKIDLEKVTTLQCSSYNCFTFLVPNEDSACLVFARDAKKGERMSDTPGATDLLEGFVCDERKSNVYSLSDANTFLSEIRVKK